MYFVKPGCASEGYKNLRSLDRVMKTKLIKRYN